MPTIFDNIDEQTIVKKYKLRIKSELVPVINFAHGSESVRDGGTVMVVFCYPTRNALKSSYGA